MDRITRKMDIFAAGYKHVTNHKRKETIKTND
jgi:hypothetical protein